MAELTRRYVVMAMATDAPFDSKDPDGVFVLKPWKDPAALRALLTYRENCYPELARDLDAWIRAVEAGPVIRGDVGRRNEAHVKPAGGGHVTARRPEARAATRRPATRRRGSRHPKRRR
jgi:hypothetical protein